MSTRTVRVDSSFDVLMRLHVDGEDSVRADYSAIAWRVLSADDATQYDAGGSLTVADVVFDTLQEDGRWAEDNTGYNFRHTIPHTVFGDVGEYVIEYTFTTTDGNEHIDVYFVAAVGATTSL